MLYRTIATFRPFGAASVTTLQRLERRRQPTEDPIEFLEAHPIQHLVSGATDLIKSYMPVPRMDRYRDLLQESTDQDEAFRDWVRVAPKGNRIDADTEHALFRVASTQRWTSMLTNAGGCTLALGMTSLPVWEQLPYDFAHLMIHESIPIVAQMAWTVAVGCWFASKYQTAAHPWKRLLIIQRVLNDRRQRPIPSPRLEL